MLHSDLSHVLNNVYGNNEEVIHLKSPIRFTIDGQEHHIVQVVKRGRSWKMMDEWNLEWTISTLEMLWQASLYYNLLSMKDTRISPANYELILLGNL